MKKNITEGEWNQQRLEAYEQLNDYFGAGSFLRVLCQRCGHALILQNHYDFSGPHPKRQAICSSVDCRRDRASTYLVA
jgi:ribosomal protein S27E